MPIFIQVVRLFLCVIYIHIDKSYLHINVIYLYVKINFMYVNHIGSTGFGCTCINKEQYMSELLYKKPTIVMCCYQW